jgi:amino acid transporter
MYYLVVNWIFVANLTPGEAITDSKAATMAHLLVAKLLGPQFGALMSVLTIVILISAMSAMIMVAPHVTSSMANDGFLPRALRATERGPSWQAQLLQFAIALLIVWAQSLRGALETVGAIILVFSTLVAFAIAFNTRHHIKPAKRLFAMLYAGPGCYFIFIGFKDKPEALLWLALPTLCATAYYFLRPSKSA